MNRKVIETFRTIRNYELLSVTSEPSCFNGDVRIFKYKVTIEKIEEPKEIYQERLQKLWDECDNWHHWQPLKEKAKSLGVELIGSAGSKRKGRK